MTAELIKLEKARHLHPELRGQFIKLLAAFTQAVDRTIDISPDTLTDPDTPGV